MCWNGCDVRGCGLLLLSVCSVVWNSGVCCGVECEVVRVVKNVCDEVSSVICSVCMPECGVSVDVTGDYCVG